MAAEHDVDADYDEHAVTVAPPEHEAAGVKAVMVSLQRGLEHRWARCAPRRRWRG